MGDGLAGVARIHEKQAHQVMGSGMLGFGGEDRADSLDRRLHLAGLAQAAGVVEGIAGGGLGHRRG